MTVILIAITLNNMKKIVVFVLFFVVWGFVLRPPVTGGTITSRFGIRITEDRSFHTGTDIGLPTGSPVSAASWGTVKQTGFTDRNGNYIIITHFPGTESRYLHLDSISVTVGESVRPGSSIGTVGNTGISTGSHLHYEIRVMNIPLPPYFLCLSGRIIQWAGGHRLADIIWDH